MFLFSSKIGGENQLCENGKNRKTIDIMSSSEDEVVASKAKRKTVLGDSSDEDDENGDRPRDSPPKAVMEDSSDEEEVAGARPRSSSPPSSPASSTTGAANKSANRIRRPSSSSSDEDEAGDRRDDSPAKSVNSRKKAAVEDSSSDEGVDDPNPVRRDTGSSDSEVDTAVHDKKGRRKGEAKVKRRKPKDAKREIYSEKNRMLRESTAALPYHRPKQRSLEEFLARKKNLPEVVSDLKVVAGGMDEEEAERRLREREKVAEEFYEAQEEGVDEDEDDEDYDPAKDKDGDGESGEEGGDGETLPEEEEIGDPAQDPADVSEKVAEASQGRNEEMGAAEDGAAASQPAASPQHDNAALVTENQEDDRPAFERQMTEASQHHQQDSESLRLVLEDDTEPLIVESSQQEEEEKDDNDDNNKEKRETKLDLSGVDLSILASKPVLGAGLGDDLVLDDEGPEKKRDLMSRFVKHVRAGLGHARTVEKDVHLTVVRKVTEDGQERLKAEDLEYHSKQVVQSPKARSDVRDRPGAQQQALKQSLRRRIDERKREERRRKMEMKAMENEEGLGPEDDEELLEDEEMEDEEEDEESYYGDEEDEEDEEDTERVLKAMDESEKKKRQKRRSQFLDEEADESDADGKDEMEHLVLEEDTCQVAAESKDKHVDEDEEAVNNASQVVDPRWTPIDERSDDDSPKDRDAASGAKKRLGFGGLLDRTDVSIDDLDDVVGLCSGQFLTQPQHEMKSQEMLSDEMKSQEMLSDEMKSQEMLSQATPDTVILTQQASLRQEPETQDTVILSRNQTPAVVTSTAVEEEEEAEPAPGFLEETPGFLLSSDDEDGAAKKVKRKPGRIVLSDDESDDDEDGGEEESDEGAEEKEEQEVQYDSDENEIVVEKPKFKGIAGKKGIRREFVENEAELSGSEDNISGDEDERGLDRLEAEAGDLDDLDEDEVRDQLERIHQRRALDEDRADVRLFQEAFLEDGELHSDKSRMRKFRWKDIDDAEELDVRDDDDDAVVLQTDEEEEKRRLERLERQKWLKDEEDGVTGEHVQDEDSQFFNLASKAVKCLEKKRATSRQAKGESGGKKPFKSPASKMPLRMLSGNQRGSFLSRKAAELERLAESTKSRGDSRTGSGANSGSANFVFAAVSPSSKGEAEEGEDGGKKAGAAVTRKRKSAGVDANAKKPRVVRTLDENSMDTIFGQM